MYQNFIFYYLGLNNIPLYVYPTFVCPFICGRTFRVFLPLPIMNDGTMNNGTQCMSVFSDFVYITKSGVYG